MLLIRATGDRSEIIRHHAVHGLVRLIDLGYAGRVIDAGAVSALQRLGEDPYRPVRETAKKALGLLDESSERGARQVRADLHNQGREDENDLVSHIMNKIG